MDQQAFRQLLSTPRPGSGSGSSGSSSRAFGLQNKRSKPESSASSSKTTPSDLKPRKVEQDKPKRTFKPRINPLTGEAYVDRATARRAGQESEFADVEKLLAEFEERAAQLETEEEREALREQYKYLGGDEKHTVLVKGLDFALLEQNKARLEAEAGQTGEEELENAFESGKAASPVQESTGAKRSREDIIEALKKRRLGGQAESSSAASTAKAEPKLGNKFKPIGFKPVSRAPADDADVKYVNGKRMRKKKKNKEEQAAGATSTPAAAMEPPPPPPTKSMSQPNKTAASSAGTTSDAEALAAPLGREDEVRKATEAVAAVDPSPPAVSASPERPPSQAAAELSVGKTSAETPPPPEQATVATAGAAIDDDGDDEDIFADAGGWNGLSDDEDDGEAHRASSSAAGAPTSAPVAAQGAGHKRDWFSSTTLAPASPSGEAAALPAELSALISHASRRIDDAATDEDESEEGQVGQTRLQGFSDSMLPSDITRALLEREERREEKRKAREEGWKKKRRGKKEGEAEEGGEEDEEQRPPKRKGKPTGRRDEDGLSD